MAWTAPITFTTGNVLTAAQMNTYVRDNSNFLHDPPMVLATRVTTQAITTGTDTAVNFSTVADSYDTDSMHSLVTNPTRLSVNTAGVYLSSGFIEWAANATGIRRCHIDPTATANPFAMASDSGPTAGALSEQCVAGTFKATTADYFELFAFQTSGGNLNVNRAAFSAQWMGSGA